MSKLTYGRLDAMLRSLGFTVRIVEDKARWYEHKPTGAVVAIPIFPDDEEALQRHLVAVRLALDNFRLTYPAELPVAISKAG
jgi:hypothetical protein